MPAFSGAAIVRKETKIVAAFREAGATGPDRGLTAASLGVHQGLAFRILLRHGVLREAGPSRLYLDEPSWEALRARRRRTAIVAVSMVVLAVVVALLLANRR